MGDVHFPPHPDVQLRRRFAAEAAAANSGPAGPASAAREIRPAIFHVLFVAALLVHFFFLTRNWHAGFLIGHEFRQAQTALITEQIDQQNNFTLRYDTPIFGPPWQAPLELPLYQWCVVGVKRLTGWPVYEAARAVSAAFFYLTLPAVFLVLGRAGLPRPRRFLVLALVLCCPVYIFYSRTFLIESTALCLSVWWLALFVETMHRRKLGWLVGAAACGALAGMVKSLTFAAWLVPAAAFGAWCLFDDWRTRRGWAAVARTIAWGFATVAVPIVLTVWWTHFCDAIKEENPATQFITSRALSTGNYGTFSLASRLSAEVWRALLHCWSYAIMPAWLLVALVAFGVTVARRARLAVALATGFFLVPQLAIPLAYGGQDYYFYAAALFVVVALGFAAHGLLDGPLPAWLRWGWLVVPVAGMWSAYFQHSGYWDMQRVWSMGGAGVMDAIREITPARSVIIVAGVDWNATLPYYAKRRALLLRNGLENDPDMVNLLVGRLDKESVSALVIANHVRSHPTIAKHLCSLLDLDPAPIFSSSWADVYLSRGLHDRALHELHNHPARFHDVKASAAKPYAAAPADQQLREISAEDAAIDFPVVQPAPHRSQAKYGFGVTEIAPGRVVFAHPESEIWVRPPAGATTIRCEFGIVDDAIRQPGGATDGVEFLVYAVRSDGSRRQIFRRALKPATEAADRGPITEQFPYSGSGDEELIFVTRPLLNYSFDWAYWRKIEVR